MSRTRATRKDSTVNGKFFHRARIAAASVLIGYLPLACGVPSRHATLSASSATSVAQASEVREPPPAPPGSTLLVAARRYPGRLIASVWSSGRVVRERVPTDLELRREPSTVSATPAVVAIDSAVLPLRLVLRVFEVPPPDLEPSAPIAELECSFDRGAAEPCLRDSGHLPVLPLELSNYFRAADTLICVLHAAWYVPYDARRARAEYSASWLWTLRKEAT
jgi:hypothetical protein